MSSKNAKTARRIAKKITMKETKQIAEAQIRQLFAAPLWLRIRFALRVIFKR